MRKIIHPSCAKNGCAEFENFLVWTVEKDVILQGDSLSILKTLPDKSVDLIFADPPYFMQTKGELLRVEGAKFEGVEDSWDKFESLRDYDDFSRQWLLESRRILKDSGSIWVIGSFQNIYRLGYLMQDLGFWILNDVVWTKPNPVPNFRGSRLCNAHETLIWCSKKKGTKYTFNYKTMKHLNGDKQEKSVWNLGICIGQERLKDANGKKIHSTQKPQKLLEKIILCASKEGDLVLDPFFGTGTTGAAAKRLGRHFIGIEKDEIYVAAAEMRIREVRCESSPISRGELEVKPPKISLNALLEAGLLRVGETFFTKNSESVCILCESGLLKDGVEELSLHKMAQKYKKAKCNGWDYFFIERDFKFLPVGTLRWSFPR